MARTRLPVKGIIFDMYGTVVDVGAVAEACSEVARDPIAFNNQWRAKQLEYTFLRTLMGKYRDFWKVTEEALAFAVERFTLQMAAEQRQRLMEAWLLPSPYPEVMMALPRLKEKHFLAVLSNGTPTMLRTGLARAGLRSHFRWLISAGSMKRYKPSPKVYQRALQRTKLRRERSFSSPLIREMWLEPKASVARSARHPGRQVGSVRPDLVVMNFDELMESV